MMSYKAEVYNLHQHVCMTGGILDILSKRGKDYFGDVLEQFDEIALIRALPFCFKDNSQNYLWKHNAFGNCKTDLDFILKLASNQ